MAVVRTLESTWPSVHPERTNLLDPNCRPKETDRARVLFEFKLDSCGTRAMVSINTDLYKIITFVFFCKCGCLTGGGVIHGL